MGGRLVLEVGSAGAIGEACHRAKLTDDTVREIRRRYAAGGVTSYALAEEFGVSSRHVRHLIRGGRRRYTA